MKLVIRRWWPGVWWWAVVIDAPDTPVWELSTQGSSDTWSEALAVGLAALEQRALLNAADDEKDEPVTTLPEFLLARIAEDEEVATAALGRNWHAQGCSELRTQPQDDPPWQQIARGDDVATFAHIARHDPARVLAECAAKRRIVEFEARWRRTVDGVNVERKPGDPWLTVTLREHGRQERVTEAEFTERFTEPAYPSQTLRWLAEPYADHPDYREEWRP